MDTRNQFTGHSNVEIHGDDQDFLRHSAEWIMGVATILCIAFALSL